MKMTTFAFAQSWARVPEMLLRLASVRIFQTASRLRAHFPKKKFALSWVRVIAHRVSAFASDAQRRKIAKTF